MTNDVKPTEPEGWHFAVTFDNHWELFPARWSVIVQLTNGGIRSYTFDSAPIARVYANEARKLPDVLRVQLVPPQMEQPE